MPIIVQSTDTTGAGITLSASDQFFLLEGTTIVADTGVGDGIIGGFDDDNIDITIAGTIIAANSAVDVRGDNINVTLTETATVFGSDLTAGFGVLSFEGEEVDVTNHGLISSPDMIGVFFGDPNSSIHNTGTISGSSGVLLYGADSTIVNSGSILGAENRSVTPTPFEGSSVYIRDHNSSLTNLAGGVISTTALSGSAVEYASTADGAVLDNFGTITSNGIGIEIRDTNSVIDIANYGVISGGTAAIQATSATENVINGGIINGDVNLGGGGDSVRSTGQINGDIDLGTGDDLYHGNGGGTVSGTISGGEGLDTIIGGAQSDVIDGGTEADLIHGGAGEDVISGGNGDDYIAGGDGDDDLSGGNNFDTIFGGAGDDTISGGSGTDTLYGGDGDDSIDAGVSSDLIGAGRGNDNIFGDGGNDTIYGFDGDDTATGNDGSDLMYGGAGRDDLNGGNGLDTIYGGDGDDIVGGGADNDSLFGGNGDDSMLGWIGADVLLGGKGEDTLLGQAGADTLDGGWGNDVLTGGVSGADTDVFRFVRFGGDDVITDFENNMDLIDLTAFNTTYGAMQSAISDYGNGALIDLNAMGGDGSIYVQGTPAAFLNANDFIF